MLRSSTQCDSKKKVTLSQLGVGEIPMDDTHTYIVDEGEVWNYLCKQEGVPVQKKDLRIKLLQAWIIMYTYKE